MRKTWIFRDTKDEARILESSWHITYYVAGNRKKRKGRKWTATYNEHLTAHLMFNATVEYGHRNFVGAYHRQYFRWRGKSWSSTKSFDRGGENSKERNVRSLLCVAIEISFFVTALPWKVESHMLACYARLHARIHVTRALTFNTAHAMLRKNGTRVAAFYFLPTSREIQNLYKRRRCMQT